MYAWHAPSAPVGGVFCDGMRTKSCATWMISSR